MKRKSILLIAIILLASGIFTTCERDVLRMPKDELKAMLGSPDLVIIDVRLEGEWNNSDSKIKGAVREKPDHIESWGNKYPKDKILVLYCNWLHEGTSASVARKLRDMGFKKVYALKGGWAEWSDSNYPTEKK